jgi:hypothetical protein
MVGLPRGLLCGPDSDLTQGGVEGKGKVWAKANAPKTFRTLVRSIPWDLV